MAYVFKVHEGMTYSVERCEVIVVSRKELAPRNGYPIAIGTLEDAIYKDSRR